MVCWFRLQVAVSAHRALIASFPAAIAVLLAVGGCASMQGGSPAAGGGSKPLPPRGTLPPPSPAVTEWTYAEAPAVPSGLKPHRLLKNFTFAEGASSLTREGQGALLEAVKDLKGNTRWHVLAVGFADDRGEAGRAMALAQQRAESARSFLRGQGIDAGRISVQALGSRYSQAKEYELQQRVRDRRVEVWAFMD